jgi:hypothetical protein
MNLREIVTRYPMLFGALSGLLIFGAAIIIETWFPWIDEALRLLPKAQLQRQSTWPLSTLHTLTKWKNTSCLRSPLLAWLPNFRSFMFLVLNSLQLGSGLPR